MRPVIKYVQLEITHAEAEIGCYCLKFSLCKYCFVVKCFKVLAVTFVRSSLAVVVALALQDKLLLHVLAKNWNACNCA